MNKNLPILTLWVFIAVTLFATACGAQVVQAAPKAATYEAVLGKSLHDREVADFIVSNNCSSTGQLQVCKDAGMALWIGQGQNVETVYLYPNRTPDFAAYKGKLPLGLAFNDTMADVEDWFGHPKVTHALQAGWEPGLPDESGTPDHIHYWAMYKRFGVTIIYNSPSATDKGATIHAILVSK
ncbi:MAG TPA: hypothetical protein VJM08_02580 [Anaerolineales bacterium]|nr:hypothetical protein [Anaerolineales bacterium]